MTAPGERLQVGCVDTPLGRVWIAATEWGVRAVTVPGGTRDGCLRTGVRDPAACEVIEGKGLVEEAIAELAAYFAGELRTFRVPLDLRGTEFQRRVWAAVAVIPYGETSTYAAIATRIGAPRAYRAVGAANGANPAAIVVPCHRVLGSDGTLTGYGGGLATKWALLDHEHDTCEAPNDISH